MRHRLRNSNKHLPPRVYQKHNAYYYVDIKRKWHRLGDTFTEAMANWAKFVSDTNKVSTMNQLFNRYMIEIAPLKSKASYKANTIQINPLRAWFGDMNPEEITPVDIYKYLDKRSLKAKVGANREKALLSHCFSMAIRWGIVRDNPCKNVKRITEIPRDRYIEDWEYKAVKSIAPELIRLLMDFAYLTGQRIGDILKMKLSDLTDEGIKIQQSKTKAKIIISWSDELRECVKNIRKLPHSIIHGFTLFCNKKGGPLTYDGFSSQWQKTMKRALDDELINESFTFHDIRAKSSSDSENRQNASDLLGHADPRITERVYNRKHKKVNPLK